MKNKKQLKIFLSYSIEDREAVLNVYSSLLEEGFKPWIDVNDIQPGTDWSVDIQKAIRESDVVLIFLSTHSVNRAGKLQKEIRTSLDIASEKPANAIYIIPVQLDNCEIPAPLDRIQSVELFKKNSWKRLMDSLNYRYRQLYGEKEIKGNIIVGDSNVNVTINTENRREFDQFFKELRDVISADLIDHASSHIFIAMPFANEMEDVYFYGILRAIDAVGFECYRSDKNAFVGDILEEVKRKLDTSIAVIADLTDSNPNVYLEVGYAWGKQKPTVLIMKKGDKLRFDVQSQKCLQYSSIRNLEEILTKELKELKSKGIIH